MNKSNWKGDERLIAKLFGTHRTPLSGGNSMHTRSDTLHPRLFIEVKKRQRHAVVSLWEKTRTMALREAKTPIVVLRTKNKQESIVVCDINDIMTIAHELFIAKSEQE